MKMTNILTDGSPETGRQQPMGPKKGRAAQQKADVTPKKAKSGTKAAPAKKAAAKPTPPKKTPAAVETASPLSHTKEASPPRAERKGAMILALISRTGGASLVEIMKATAWQPHSVRGFLSTAGKKRGLEIESTKRDDGLRNYTLKH